MEETLKSVRSIHLVLAGVCAAIAIFAASPRQIGAYSRAKKELEALRQLDLEDLRREIKEEVQERLPGSLPWIKPSSLFPAGKITASLSPLDLFRIRSSQATLTRLEAGAPLEEWLKFFDTPLVIIAVVPEQNNSDFVTFRESLIAFARNRPDPILQTLSFKDQSDVDDSETSLPAYAVCASSDTFLGDVIAASVPAIARSISYDALRPWLATAESARNLRDATTADGTWLRNLRAMRNEVGVLKIPEAAQYLENRITSEKNRNISVLGASVDQELAVVAAPVGALLTLLYFGLNLRHLAVLLSRSPTEAQSFPWVGLFPGCFAANLAHGSLWLPVAVSLWLLSASWRYARASSLTVATALLLMIVAAAVLASNHLVKIRRFLDERSLAEQNSTSQMEPDDAE